MLIVLTSLPSKVVTGPEHSLAFLLADSGFDVWLGNYRGETLTQTHKYTNTQKQKTWLGNYPRDYV